MNNLLESPKQLFVDEVTKRLLSIPQVLSVTFTGSFVDKKGLQEISDIDVVVVVDKLDKAVFETCKATAASVPTALLGLNDHKLIINDSFGPLKLYEAKSAVLHLMIYDLPGHRIHVRESPFTCYDWERSECYKGHSLKELYPVVALQPNQFLNARRGILSYCEDIAAGKLTYRVYEGHGGHFREVVKAMPLDNRHKVEYSYHIVRNLIANYVKFLRQENTYLTDEDVFNACECELAYFASYIPWLRELCDSKHNRRQQQQDVRLHERVANFVNAFSKYLGDTWSGRATRHVFARHARTAFSPERFLGQRIDPPIAENPNPLNGNFAEVFTSPSLRCLQTATSFAEQSQLKIDQRLSEIDYGQAEGMNVHELEKLFPQIVQEWTDGKDPSFPNGENTQAVYRRIASFLDQLPATPCLIVTHNVVLRCLLGSNLRVPIRYWHRLPVEFAEPIELCVLDGKRYLDLTPQQLARIATALSVRCANS